MLFTLIGTVVGANFGIKVSSDATKRAQNALEKANERLRRANDLARVAHGKHDQNDSIVIGKPGR